MNFSKSKSTQRPTPAETTQRNKVSRAQRFRKWQPLPSVTLDDIGTEELRQYLDNFKKSHETINTTCNLKIIESNSLKRSQATKAHIDRGQNKTNSLIKAQTLHLERGLATNEQYLTVKNKLREKEKENIILKGKVKAGEEQKERMKLMFFDLALEKRLAVPLAAQAKIVESVANVSSDSDDTVKCYVDDKVSRMVIVAPDVPNTRSEDGVDMLTAVAVPERRCALANQMERVNGPGTSLSK